MKKKLFFVLVLLNSLHTSSCVRNGTDYFGLNKKETALMQDDVFPLYREKIIKVNGRDIRLYQANYSRKNLKFISGITSTETPEQYSCTWQIGRELLDIQSNFTEKNLNEYIEKEKLNEIADYYIKELYNQKYARTLYYSSYEIHPLDENNGKWIIFFIYVTKDHQGDKNYWDEVVFMLPDGTIVISENNFEEIKFE
jgi:hypothetical protein